MMLPFVAVRFGAKCPIPLIDISLGDDILTYKRIGRSSARSRNESAVGWVLLPETPMISSPR